MFSTLALAGSWQVCSPVEVNWHVDQRCCILSAQAMDNLCKELLHGLPLPCSACFGVLSGHDRCWAGSRRLPEGLAPACGSALGLGCASAFTDFPSWASRVTACASDREVTFPLVPQGAGIVQQG